ncbi:hypothetical protein MARHY2079 [Marinobacter nauticus ATCC 49840]|nr:hypothetical protein MARHY2079 [Marinobacter nauticus ATCC 49840]
MAAAVTGSITQPERATVSSVRIMIFVPQLLAVFWLASQTATA